MLRRIVHTDTEVARALVDDERTRLEGGDGLFVVVVEILEGHEVAQQAVEIAVEK